MEKYNIFGINVCLGNYETLVNKFFANKSITYTCVNQYYLNLAYNDNFYKNEINNFDIIHPDGIGTNLAIKFLSNFKTRTVRINGSDLYFKLLDEVTKRSLKLFVFGDSKEVLNKAIEKIIKKFIGIKIVGSHDGYIEIDDISVANKIIELQPDVLFVGLGTKKQEAWINLWKNRLPKTRIIAIGGGLRVIGEDRPRGSKLIQKIGLEWLVRLINEPKNYWKRYIIGIPLFIYRIIKLKIEYSFSNYYKKTT